ncbi:MAG TPA: IS1595 family transposase [Xanthobacteraceae bacterium]|nr:IS1595 family transposase [Xanthobacteraceae bacterium]
MSKSVIDANCFHDEPAAYAWVEARLWPEGPICPRCGGVERISKMAGKTTRIGVYKCYQCRKPFRVTVGTVFEASHVPLRLWLQAMYLLCSSKKGISSNQLHRTLGVTLKTAWFMSHRLREAMRVVGMEPMGGAGEIVEIDETTAGWQEGAPKRAHPKPYGWQFRNVVLTLVQRGGEARSFHVDSLSMADILPVVRKNVARESSIMTDDATRYKKLDEEFASHESVTHAEGEYVRGPIHTNTVEGYYSVFKRGMKGVYQHCKEKHLHRYLAEFDFRYSNRVRLGYDDVERTERALKGIVGKRLTYRTTGV